MEKETATEYKKLRVVGLNYLIFSVLRIFFLGNRKKKFEYKIEKKIIEEELRKERRIVFMGSLNNSEAF